MPWFSQSSLLADQIASKTPNSVLTQVAARGMYGVNSNGWLSLEREWQAKFKFPFGQDFCGRLAYEIARDGKFENSEEMVCEQPSTLVQIVHDRFLVDAL